VFAYIGTVVDLKRCSRMLCYAQLAEDYVTSVMKGVSKDETKV